jgi:hypothetical protein
VSRGKGVPTRWPRPTAVVLPLLLAVVASKGCAPAADVGAELEGHGSAVEQKQSPTASDTLPPRFELISPHAVLVAAGEPGWEYVRATRVDLDGDGVEEQVVLLADVTLREGQPLWEHSHQWQLYVESVSGERTHVIAQVVHHGELKVAISEPQPGTAPVLVILAHTPHRIAVYQVEYRAGVAELVDAYEVELSTRYWMTRPE